MSRLNKTWTAGEGQSALATELHNVLQVSHRQAKGIIDGGCVKVNGELVHGYGQRLKPGDKVEVGFDPDTTYQTLPQPKKQIDKTGFKILWEDTHLVFVNKPAGLLTVPSEKGQEPCLAEAITDHYRRRGFKRFQLYIIHRLDRFSSGVLVFAKTPEALHGLKRMFEEHHLNRIYKAILVGELPENAGTLTGKLIEHAKSLRMSVVQPKKNEPKGAKHAITHYRVLERLPGHTVVEVKLETGRRNQIRVQFADRGFPLLGDQVYGVESELIDRQSLHAELLGFRHPVTGEAVTISAPLPADMEKALKVLRTQRRVERASEGIQGEEGIYRPKITNARKVDRMRRASRYTEEGDARPSERSSEKPSARSGERSGERRTPGRPRPEGERPARRIEGARPERSAGDRERPRTPRRAEDSERPRTARPDRAPRSGEDRDRPRTPRTPRTPGAGTPGAGTPGDRPRREGRSEGEAPRPRSTSSRPASPRSTSPRTGPDSRPRRSAEGDASRSERPRPSSSAPRGASRGPGSKPRSEGPKRTFGAGKPRGGKK